MNDWTSCVVRFDPVLPTGGARLLVGGLVVATLVAAAVLRRRGTAGRWVLWLTGVRLAAVAIFALLLARPTISWTESAPARAELLVLLDRSASMSQPTSAGGSRWSQSQAALADGEFAATLRERFRVRAYDFAASAEPAGPVSRVPDGPTTHLANALDSAVRHARASGAAADRLLLVSDGLDRGTVDPADVTRALGVRVDVLAPDDGPRATLEPELLEVQGSRRVLLGSETLFRATVARASSPSESASKTAGEKTSGAGSPSHDLTVVLEADGERLVERPVTFESASAEVATVTLPYRPERPGSQVFEVRLLAGTKPTRPRGLQHAVEVVDRQFEVLVLEDTWRWEFRFLRRLLEDDPSVRFSALLSRGNTVAQFASPDRRTELIGVPENPADLAPFDLFFLGDVQLDRWPDHLPSTLGRLVREEGRSLVVLAGPGLGRLAEHAELESLLPVELTPDSGQPVEGPVDLRLRPEARDSAFFFRVPAEPGALPPLDRVYPVRRKRAGAQVLLEASSRRNDFGPLIVAAEHTIGRGRVLFVGTDTLWKWQTLADAGAGPTPYATFWQQAFRALAPDRPHAEPVRFWLTPRPSRPTVGGTLSLRAEIEAQRRLESPRIEATCERPDGGRVPIVFRADDVSGSGGLRADFVAATAGPHVVAARLVSGAGQTLAETSLTWTTVPAPSETDAAPVDRDRLRRLAEATGGQWVARDRSETWPRPDAAQAVAESRTKSVNLWQNLSLLVALTLVLGADWLSRLRLGLL